MSLDISLFLYAHSHLFSVCDIYNISMYILFTLCICIYLYIMLLMTDGAFMYI